MWLITAAAAVVIAVVVGVVVVITGGPGDSKPATAGDAVRDYLDALATGDAARALSYGVNPPKDTSLLTDEVLAAQNKSHPITDVQIVDSTADGEVHVTANFGDQAVDEELRLTKTADGSWKLPHATYTLDFNTDQVSSNAPLLDSVTLFGKPIPKSGRPDLFPGVVEIGNANPNVTTTLTDPAHLLGSELSEGSTTAQFDFGFTDAGAREAKRPIIALIGECAKSNLLAPPNCPQNASYNTSLVDGTATWTPPANADEVTVNALKADGTFRAFGYVDYRLSARAQNPVLNVDDMSSSALVAGFGNIAANPPTFTLQKG